MLVKSVFMELRSRLRSCNVYITTNVDFKKDCNLKISIQSNCIVLNYYDNDLKRYDSLSSIESLSDYSEEESDVTCVIPIQEFCFIIPNSMSCLKIEKNTVSFRILTEPKNGGNFYSEIISTSSISKEIKVDKLEVNFNAKEDMKIVCGNCSNVLSHGSLKFDRILELPTANLDMSEWFCHGHSHGSSTSHDDVLKPNNLDFLYRLTFFVVNNTILSEKANKFNSKRTIYHCNRCLAWLGVKNKDTVKFYNNDVKIHHNSNIKHIFTHKKPTQDVTIDDFIYTVESLTREFNLGLQYTMMCKIVLECTMSASTKQYLLIWVMDKELQVLRNDENSIKPDRVMLKSSFLTKILYKIELELNDEVETWLADPSAVSTDISKSMFSHGLNHLEQMSLKVPESFRYTNGYTVSYLKA
ncbi:jg27933 [Pararge aegeria aegeria]|uniref:E3 ubiquitin-protein ligase E3D n=2 Tax=Pararge aegeria TaxID=116150 RepID=A0A8S4R470_9NEOP|nr:jg27933 [Pararge aegeria aegeria]